MIRKFFKFYLLAYLQLHFIGYERSIFFTTVSANQEEDDLRFENKILFLYNYYEIFNKIDQTNKVKFDLNVSMSKFYIEEKFDTAKLKIFFDNFDYKVVLNKFIINLHENENTVRYHQNLTEFIEIIKTDFKDMKNIIKNINLEDKKLFIRSLEYLDVNINKILFQNFPYNKEIFFYFFENYKRSKSLNNGINTEKISKDDFLKLFLPKENDVIDIELLKFEFLVEISEEIRKILKIEFFEKKFIDNINECPDGMYFTKELFKNNIFIKKLVNFIIKLQNLPCFFVDNEHEKDILGISHKFLEDVSFYLYYYVNSLENIKKIREIISKDIDFAFNEDIIILIVSDILKIFTILNEEGFYNEQTEKSFFENYIKILKNIDKTLIDSYIHFRFIFEDFVFSYNFSQAKEETNLSKRCFRTYNIY
ncbi:hypothetical protein GVAV_000070 [Gurleya vavrai]